MNSAADALPADALHRALLEAVLDPTVAIDAHGTVVLASRSVEAVFGWNPDELRGQNIKVLMPEPHRSAHDGYLANYRRTGETNILNRTREFEVIRKDGRAVPVELSVARADFPGREPLFIGSFRDISRRREAEAELERARRAENAVQRTLATLGESAAMLAHEIKNPITAVNVALRAVSKQLGEDERAVLEDLSARMQRLQELMKRTLSISKPHELRLSMLDARELLELAVRGKHAEIESGRAKVRIAAEGKDLSFPGDRQLLEEVLANLIQNSLEAAPTPRRIELECARREGQIVFAIEDDGPGIPAARCANLFKPFSSTKSGGTGLGLAFCRKVVEEHGGTIEVRPAALGGARFEFRLPAMGRGPSS